MLLLHAARNAEHFSTSQSAPGQYKSAIMQHAADAQHHFRKDDIQVISHEDNWHDRGIEERISTSAVFPLAFYRNEGRHQLPHCYDSIIQKFVKKTEPPETHKPSEQRLNTAKRPPGRPRTNYEASQTVPKVAPTNVTQEANQTAPKVAPTKISKEPTHRMVTRSRGTHGEAPGHP